MKLDSAFQEVLYYNLIEKKFDDVLEILKCPGNESLVSENIWDLTNLICLAVKTNNLLKNDTDIVLCKKILLYLVDKGNPKEALMALLEEADSFKDNEFFCLLLDPLLLVLKKIPGKRGRSLQWVLSTFNAHIQTLNAPQDLDLQKEEKLLLDADPAVQNTVFVLSNYLNFIEFFVDEVSFENLKGKEIHYFDRICNQQEIMHRYILKLFEQPLLYHDLHMLSSPMPKSDIQVICEGYINCLSKICCNVFNLFKYNCLIDDDDDEDNSVPLLAFSNLSYLIFVEKIAVKFQPFVYSHHFVFMNNLKYIISLLNMKENLVLFKGLYLAQTLINQLNISELNYDCIELEEFTEFHKLLLNVAIFCQIKEHRHLAFDIFMTYISTLNCKGRYHLIIQVISTIKHSGVEGVMINLYKNYLHKALDSSHISDTYFLGKNLILFLKKIFVLDEGVETDIIDHSDRIVATLNFLRYLIIRDKKENNITGIWNLINTITENYLNPLSIGIDLSRAHYKLAMKNAVTAMKDEDSLKKATVSVNSEIFPNVPLHLQKDILIKAVMTFDVIESILFRIKELAFI